MTIGNTFKTGAIVLAALGLTATAHAQGFGGLKDRLKKQVTGEVAEEVVNAATTGAPAPEAGPPAPASDAAPALPGKPAASLVSMVKCSTLKPTNIVIGTMGNYTFQDGFQTETRSGLINRRDASLSDGCILPSLQAREIAYMEVDTAALKAMGSSNDWSMQCVRSANPSAGAVAEKESRTESPYNVDYLAGKDMLLHCGNSEGIAECAEGSNSNRSGAWDKKLKARSKTMISINAPTSTLSPAGGEKLFCQYYNSQKRVGLFAFEYLRTRK